MNAKPILILATLLATACATTETTEATRIKLSDEKGVSTCQYLGDAQGKSLMGGVMMQAAIDSATAEARNKAAAMQATHIVMSPVQANMSGATVHGRAYRCH